MDLGIEEFGMALGLGDEMSRGEMDDEKERLKREAEERAEQKDMEELVDLQMKLAEDTTPGVFSIKSRRKTKSRPLDEFQEYVDAVLRGEIDVEWATFNDRG